MLDSTALTPRQTAEHIAGAVLAGAGMCEIVQTPEPTAETLAAGVLLFDEADRVLLVDPTYKPGWEFPGGVVEPGEPPGQAGVREVAEELGVRLEQPLPLLVVDWEPPRPPGYGGLRLLLDGGRLTAEAARQVLLPGAELRGWRFVTEDEAARLLPPQRLIRLRWALRARAPGTPALSGGGRPGRLTGGQTVLCAYFRRNSASARESRSSSWGDTLSLTAWICASGSLSPISRIWASG